MVSNLGTWIQRTAQDWLVLAELTKHDARAVGVVMALQFGPQFVLLPWTGHAADTFDRRKLLMVAQISLCMVSMLLGILVLSGMVRLWHVYGIALLSGIVSAFEAPTRQVFAGSLVGDDDLANAVALNSASFNTALLIGPAMAGLCISALGTGWAFIFNGLSFFGVFVTLAKLKVDEPHKAGLPHRNKTSLLDGFRYIWGRRDLRNVSIMLFIVGTFGMNFPIFISTMAIAVFHADARHYGMLNSAVALGTLAGALFLTGQSHPTIRTIVTAAMVFTTGYLLAAIAPGYWLFAGALALIGLATLMFTNATITMMQVSTEPAMRGRVMAIRLAIALGGTPIGAPIVGWIAHDIGPRWALGLAALAGLTATVIGLCHARKSAARPD